MSSDDTRILTEAVDRQELDGRGVRGLLIRYFYENSDVIWSDSLEAHGLLTMNMPTSSEPTLSGHFPNGKGGK
jgi:hypothetical protein